VNTETARPRTASETLDQWGATHLSQRFRRRARRAVSVFTMIALGFVPAGSFIVGSIASVIGLERRVSARGRNVLRRPGGGVDVPSRRAYGLGPDKKKASRLERLATRARA